MSPPTPSNWPPAPFTGPSARTEALRRAQQVASLRLAALGVAAALLWPGTACGQDARTFDGGFVHVGDQAEATLVLEQDGTSVTGSLVAGDGSVYILLGEVEGEEVHGAIESFEGVGFFRASWDEGALVLMVGDLDPETSEPLPATAIRLDFRQSSQVGAQARGTPPGPTDAPAPTPAPGQAPGPGPQGQLDPNLIGTWAASSTSGSTGGGGSVWMTSQEVVSFSPDGTLVYSTGSTVSADVPGVSAYGPGDPNAMRGRWSVEGNTIVVHWDHGEVARYGYSVFMHTDGMPALAITPPGGEAQYYRPRY